MHFFKKKYYAHQESSKTDFDNVNELPNHELHS